MHDHKQRQLNNTTYYGNGKQEMSFAQAGGSSAPLDAAIRADRQQSASFSSAPALTSSFPAFSWGSSSSGAPPFSSAPLPRRKRARSRSQKGDDPGVLSSPPSSFSDAQNRHDKIEYGADSDSCDSDSERAEPLTPSYRYGDDGSGRTGSPEKATHPKKRQRPHLNTDDVGRFAGMSIFEGRNTGTSRTIELTRQAGLGAPPSSPLSPVRAPPASPIGAGAGARASGPLSSSMALQGSIGGSRFDEGGDQAQDANMGQGASSWELDRYRSYIANLEDEADTSGSDTQGDQSDAHVGTAETTRYTAITQAEAEQVAFLQQRRFFKERAGGRMSDADIDDEASSQPSSFAINPELLAKLEAHSRAVVLGGDISSRPIAGRKSRGVTPAVTPPDQEEAKGALVLWRSPEEILAPAGSVAPREGATGNSSMAEVSPCGSLATASVSAARQTFSNTAGVGTEPLFAFGTHSPPRTFSPMFGAVAADKIGRRVHSGAVDAATTADEVDEEMDLDD